GRVVRCLRRQIRLPVRSRVTRVEVDDPLECLRHDDPPPLAWPGRPSPGLTLSAAPSLRLLRREYMPQNAVFTNRLLAPAVAWRPNRLGPPRTSTRGAWISPPAAYRGPGYPARSAGIAAGWPPSPRRSPWRGAVPNRASTPDRRVRGDRGTDRTPAGWAA